MAMSLIAILFDFMYSIRSSSDLGEILNVGNELYTRLSQSTRQDFLMLTELPDLLCLRDTMYGLKYSDSYFGNLYNGNDSTKERHCVPLIEAFELLIRDDFASFILTITSFTVAILLKSNGIFKVFDSHSRDFQGMFDPCGTCVLVEIASIYKLVEYFENLYLGIRDAVYELKGVKISTDVSGSRDGQITREASMQVDSENLNKTELISDSPLEIDRLFCSCTECCFVCFYAICFSILKEIRYWNESTLDLRTLLSTEHECECYVIEYYSRVWSKVRMDQGMGEVFWLGRGEGGGESSGQLAKLDVVKNFDTFKFLL